ncbi:hypothetical protein NLM27_20345 [Bradyrhizobium sp. CCGB12]|uniref:hypothetical protein n=1 Tax=Bradyrhizobium sp. CCGB12 TaxID=2949632 RepID=UPI0020B1834C|nr:hypothetical protein [Bradyrhizobium sp. CCGB12]MCP3391138.1 hypothetical protein [Bradyrhizobium sp. CCGB12]
MARFLFLASPWRDFLGCRASAAARKIACHALITMDKTASKIKYAPRKNKFRPAKLTQAGN